MKRLDETRQTLVTNNVRLAYYYAWKVYRRSYSVPADDLKAEAAFALAIAAATYNDSLGVPFKMYAILLIRRRLRGVVKKWRAWGHTPHFQLDDEFAWDKDAKLDSEPEIDRDEDYRRVRRYLHAEQFNLLQERYVEGACVEQMAMRRGITPARVYQKLIAAKSKAGKALAYA